MSQVHEMEAGLGLRANAPEDVAARGDGDGVVCSVSRQATLLAQGAEREGEIT